MARRPGLGDAVWDVTVFTNNRDRLLEGEIAARFLRAVLDQPKVKALLSDEHFSVDGTKSPLFPQPVRTRAPASSPVRPSTGRASWPCARIGRPQPTGQAS